MFNSQKPQIEDLPTSRQLFRATALAVVAAGAILVAVVLPSEYAIDPTGIGRQLGLTQMGEIKAQLAEEAAADAAAGAAPAAPVSQTAPAKVAAVGAATATRTDTMKVTLAPGQGAEITLAKTQPGGIYDKTTRGTRQYLKTPRLRGLLAVTLAAAAASAMVIVNTPVLVRGVLGLGQSEVAITLAAFGGGSMIAALLLPRLLDRFADRSIMIAAAAFMTAILALLTASWAVTDASRPWPIILLGWFALGLSYAASITPGGRLLRRSSGAEDRPALFAAKFALSHVCWLIAYPLAGQVGARAGMDAALGASAVLALVGTLIAIRIWPQGDPDVLAHRHDDLPPDHPHVVEGHAQGEAKHAYVIDELHPEWPGR